MNRIVLIGNGFDLSHGLATKYEDFINDFWIDVFNESKDLAGGFEKDCVKLHISAINYTLHYLSEGKVPQNIQELNKIIDKYTSPKIEFNIDNKFLEKISENISVLNNWVDIENEYYKFLCYVFDKNKFFTYNYYERKSVADLNNDFNYIKQKLEQYLTVIIESSKIEKKEKIWNIIYAPFYLNDFTEQAKNEIAFNETEKIKKHYDKLNVDLNISPKTIPLLESNFGLIDKFLNQKLNVKFISSKDVKLPPLNYLDLEGFLKIILEYPEISNNYFDLLPTDYMFLNFNYTNLEEEYIDKKSKEINPLDIHIHGELKDPENPIIFGYGDELEENYTKIENLQDNEYLENIKSIKYQETNNYKNMLNFINSDKYQIIILGHSCGNSDRTLLNTLFEHENCVSIKPYYYQYKDEKTEEIKDNYSDIVRNISRSFTDKKSMRDKVVNKTYCDWFSSNVE